MLLTIDVGNTNIKLGLYEGDQLGARWRISTDRDKLSAEYAALVHSLLALQQIPAASITGAVLSSVVPPLTGVFVELCRDYLSCDPVVVGPGVKTGMRLLIDTPRELGSDRVCNAVAAHRRHGGPVIAIAFGTATAFDVISAEGDYIGGAIAPGVGIAAEALFRSAAKLYQVELVRPPKVIGKNTVHYMQSGIVLGYTGLVEGLVSRMWAELETRGVVVATGGLADVIAAETTVIDHVDHFLTNEGLRLIYELNR